MLANTFESTEQDTALNEDADATPDEVEYVFEGYRIEFSKKIMLIPAGTLPDLRSVNGVRPGNHG